MRGYRNSESNDTPESENLALNGAARCEKTTRHGENAGNRCKNPALVGRKVCKSHGGSLPTEKRKSEMAKIERAEAIRPLKRDDPRVRGDSALAEELARTLAWIDFCEDRLNELGAAVTYDDEMAPGLSAVLAGLQLVSRERIGAGEWPGTNETEMVTVNVWEEKLRWNRAHLTVLTKQWLAAGFEARRLEMARSTTERIVAAIDGVVRDLGLNPGDPAVRRIIRDRLRAASGRDDTDNVVDA